MDVKVNFAVVHELIKEQFKDIQKSDIREVVLKKDKPAVNKLIIGATSIYGKKNNATHYGIFAKKTVSDFPKDFDAYSKIEISEKSFLEITESAMVELFAAAKKTTASSGGYILFVDYENSQGRFLLIAMLKKRDGLRLNEHLEPEELIELDLSSLYHAARINFNKYNEHAAADDEAKQELNYLSFLSQSAGRSAAGYFVTALGCAVGTASAAATKNRILESVKFFRERPNLRDKRIQFKDEVLRYLERQRDSGQSVKLSEVEAIARQFFPAEMEGEADDLASEFIGHLNSEAVGIGGLKFQVQQSVDRIQVIGRQELQVLGQHLYGEFPAQGLARPRVQQVSDLIEPLLSHQRQVRSLGQILAQQPVGVLVAAPLPGAVGVGEVDLHARACAQFGVLGHFTALVVGHGLEQRGGHA